jgi:transcription antitermination factor NusG
MESLPETASVTSAGTNNTTITASLASGETFAKGDKIEVDSDPFSFVDLAGNIEEIYLMEIGAVIT